MPSCVIIIPGSNGARVVYWIQSFSPVRELRADQVLSLGSLVTEMTDRELQATAPTDLGVLAHLGTLSNWNPKKVSPPSLVLSSYGTKQLESKKPWILKLSFSIFFSKMRATITGVMWKRKLTVEQFAATDLATFSHLICGLHPSEIRRLSPYNLRWPLCL